MHPASPTRATSPRGVSTVPSPYGVHAHPGDFLHQPGEFHNPVDLDAKYRRGAGGASASAASERSKSPGSSSRNRSFKTAVSGGRGSGSPRRVGPGVPLAAEEDLSPVSPDTPTRRAHAAAFAPHVSPAANRRGEAIPLGDYETQNGRNRFRDSGIADTHISSPDGNSRNALGGGGSPTPSSEPRPPVEGRDSMRRKGESGMLTTPDRQNGNFISGPGGEKPGLKPLPLRNVQRPDGQSPEHNTEEGDSNANRAAQQAPAPTGSPGGDLSPILRKTALFADPAGSHPGSPGSVEPLGADDGFEYDDYMPSLPGSFFTMDPGAYTLTWSAQPQWSHSAQNTPPTAAHHKHPDQRHESNA